MRRVELNPTSGFLLYMLQDSVTGKIYIGQTTRSVKNRWFDHVYWAEHEYNHPLYNAMRKYGVKQFSISLLCCCSNQPELDNAEAFIINLLGATKSTLGYNLLGKSRGQGTRGRLTEAHKEAQRKSWTTERRRINGERLSRRNKTIDWDAFWTSERRQVISDARKKFNLTADLRIFSHEWTEEAVEAQSRRMIKHYQDGGKVRGPNHSSDRSRYKRVWSDEDRKAHSETMKLHYARGGKRRAAKIL